MEGTKEAKKPFPWKVFSVAMFLFFWMIGLPLGYNLYWIYGTPRGERYRTVGAEVQYSDRGKQVTGEVVESKIDFFQSRSLVTLRVKIEQVPQYRVDEFGNVEVGGGMGGTIDPYFNAPGATR